MTDEEFWKNIAERWSCSPRAYDDHGEAAIDRWLTEGESRVQRTYKKNFLEEEEDDDDW